MGGRGTALVAVTSAAIATVKLMEEAQPALARDGEKGYELQSRGDFPSGRSYALLEATGRDWRIVRFCCKKLLDQLF